MRTLSVFFVIPLVTIVYSVTVLVHMVLFRDRDVFYRYARSWSRVLLRLAGVRVILTEPGTNSHLHAGPTPVKAEYHPAQRYIYAANHSSLFDIPVVLAYLPDNVRIMYKQELERIPIFGWCLKYSPFIPINRTKARDANSAIDATAGTIRSGTSVLVFPEGTRSADGQPGPFKRGVATLAMRSSVAVRPVAIVGTAAIMPARTYRVSGGTVNLIVMPALSLNATAGRDQQNEFVEHIRSAIVSHVTLQHDT